MAQKPLVLLCQHFYPEMVSTGMHLTELSARLAELGWQLTVYCAKPSWGMNKPERDSISKEIFFQGIRILRVPTFGEQQGNLFSRGLFGITFLLSVCWALWHERAGYPGVVVTTNPPFLGLAGWLYARLFGRPYLLIVYDIYPDIAVKLGVLSPRSWLAKAWDRCTRLILDKAAVVVVIGRDMADIVKSKMPARLHERIVLIPNWSDERHIKPIPRDTNRFRRDHQLDGAFVVQYSGRMGRTHNLEPLIEAARLMTGERVVFQFVGEGAKKAKLQALAAAYGLNNVQFLPYQPMEHLAEMLSGADLAVVCLESIFTGLSVPSKTYGVIASGTPILGFLDPESEIGQMIAEAGCGLVMRDPTGDQIAAAIRQLMLDSANLNAMGSAGRSIFLEKYTLAHAALAYDRALTIMLNNSANYTAGIADRFSSS
jgi:glycosyltransferase involved in cell wall biosynthesis